ncbi:hypothetical protein [Spirosoma foliorum]|uniref:Uncharacterized protein n=1 Tax=Spirosoma foliorum TaxID=2710596 RepID=A0A7G5H2U5_9BACT|nr:hypothetical protein [Spirosoma foliorum]QMW05437.1 hypothetical protein H3H32_11365 [Spirosoma foliorum]
MLIETLIALLFAGAVITLLVWNDIYTWLNGNQVSEAKYAEIIKEKLDNGNYKVVAGVFTKKGATLATKAWETKELDKDLQSKFGWNDKIKITY